MDFGLTFEKLLLIGVIAAVIIGPERLPKAAETFAGFVRKAGDYLRDAKTRVRDEMGAEVEDVDWRKLDPRQYDPRRIIRDALMDDGASPRGASASPPPIKPLRPEEEAAMSAASAPIKMRPEFTRLMPPPFDREAT